MKTQRTSRLEIYVQILQVLETIQTASLHAIREKIDISQAALEKALCFLEKQELVTKEIFNNEAVYEMTLRGDRVNRYFNGNCQEISQASLA